MIESPDIIAAQFNGPPKSGNGGYVCGMLAHRLTEHLPGAAVISSSLRKPPPLDTEISWRLEPDSVTLVDAAGEAIGFAEPSSFEAEPPPCPDLESAGRATQAYEGHAYHPFATCFVCGTARGIGDGLRVFSGRIDADNVAAVWAPHENFCGPDRRLGYEFAWSAMDCPGGWAAHIDHEPMVLARMTASVDMLPVAGEECIVVGRIVRSERRKRFTSTALYSAGGALLGRAEQLWIAINIADFS